MIRSLTFAAALACFAVLGLTASAGDPLLHLHDAVAQGKVSVEVIAIGGSTGDTIQISVKRLGRDALRLDLAPGTVFRSVSGKVQDMAGARIRGERSGASAYTPAAQIDLPDDQPHVYVVEAYCMDFHKANPGAGEKFRMEGPTPETAAFMTAAVASGRSIEQVQAALWIKRERITDTELAARFPITAEALKSARAWLASQVRPTPEVGNSSPPAGPSPAATQEQVERAVVEIAAGCVLKDCFEKVSQFAMPSIASLPRSFAAKYAVCFDVTWGDYETREGKQVLPTELSILKANSKIIANLALSDPAYLDAVLKNSTFSRRAEERELHHMLEVRYGTKMTSADAERLVKLEARVQAEMPPEAVLSLNALGDAIRKGLMTHPEVVAAYVAWWNDTPSELASVRKRVEGLLGQAREQLAAARPTSREPQGSPSAPPSPRPEEKPAR